MERLLASLLLQLLCVPSPTNIKDGRSSRISSTASRSTTGSSERKGKANNSDINSDVNARIAKRQACFPGKLAKTSMHSHTMLNHM